MNLQQYADHRKVKGLRGTSHVAVIKAIEKGRLMPPAVKREGSSWLIDPDLADEQWANTTSPAERGTGHHLGQGPATAQASANDQPPLKQPSTQRAITAGLPRGKVPERAESEKMIAAIKAQREALALQQEQEKLVYKEDMEIAYNAVLLQLTTLASSAHKRIKAMIPHLTHEELSEIERIISEIFESVSSNEFEELPE